ncbi:hypothetical protein [Sulfitobacter sp. PS-8MA]|uniref:hypothetical protein n=1 Tax=Sulfitobacter sp. PS-8MA TaxID=3237707 RepID=UPI0034C6AF2A
MTAVVCDLTVAALCTINKSLYVTRSNRHLGRTSRYGDPTTSKTFPRLLDLLADPGLVLIHQELGSRTADGKRRRTVIRPSATLLRIIRKHSVSLEDIGELLRTEPIELKGQPFGRKKRNKLIDYDETDFTTKARKHIQEINNALANADIRYTGPEVVDINQRQLRRSFNRESFESGGRLWGGFWQSMSKKDRLRYIRIDGKEVVEVDYGQVMPRLLYAIKGVAPPMQDLYDIPGIDGERQGIKKVMSSMQFVEKPLSRFPQGTCRYFGRDVRVKDVENAILSTHPDIADTFHRGLGHRCQFMESQILVEVLRVLNGMGVVPLPIHDAILVPASAVDLAQRVMLYTFKRHTGQDGEVDVLTKHDFGPDDDLQLAA